MRDVRAHDIDLAYGITREAMRQHVERTWGVWDEGEQTEKQRAAVAKRPDAGCRRSGT